MKRIGCSFNHVFTFFNINKPVVAIIGIKELRSTLCCQQTREQLGLCAWNQVDSEKVKNVSCQTGRGRRMKESIRGETSFPIYSHSLTYTKVCE